MPFNDWLHDKPDHPHLHDLLQVPDAQSRCLHMPDLLPGILRHNHVSVHGGAATLWELLARSEGNLPSQLSPAGSRVSQEGHKNGEKKWKENFQLRVGEEKTYAMEISIFSLFLSETLIQTLPDPDHSPPPPPHGLPPHRRHRLASSGQTSLHQETHFADN